MEFLSSRSVRNSNLTLETDEQKGEKKKKKKESGEEVHFTPWERIFTYYARLPVPHERVRRRVEIVENDKQGESYSNRKTRSWI